ncbi:MAG: IS5/IS1182 family transposase, partial [Puniceicoccales bacterium]|nr:IS5/IS1182 family transposase [Puniceicoccales bacterium]
MISGIAYVLRNGLRWKDAPGNTVHPRRCTTVSSDGGGIFAKILQKLSKCKTEISMMDATHLKVHRTAA